MKKQEVQMVFIGAGNSISAASNDARARQREYLGVLRDQYGRKNVKLKATSWQSPVVRPGGSITIDCTTSYEISS